MKTKIKRLSRRSLSMLLAVLMMVSVLMVGTVSANAADTKLIYINTTNWGDSESTVAYYAWAWKSGNGGNWYDFSKQTDHYYYIEVPSDVDSYIFFRAKNNMSHGWTEGTNYWNRTNGDLSGQSGKNIYSFSGYSTGSWTTYLPTSNASLSGSASITTTQTAQLTPSLTSNTTYNEIKSTSYSVTTNPGSAGSVTSAGVFSATAAGNYTVTATVTYNAKGYTGITKNATATANITVTSAANPAASSVSLSADISTVYVNATPVTYTATASDVVSGATFNFKVDGTSVQNTSSNTYTTTFTSTGTKSVTVTVQESSHDDVTSSAVSTTVKAQPSVYFKQSTTKSDVSNGGEGTQVAMSYDSTASTTLGKSNHVVYKATLSSLSAAAHYWVIYDGSRSANRYYATNINSNSGRIGGTGYSTVAHTNGNSGTITPPYAGNTYVYYDIIDGKFYTELPIRVSHYGAYDSSSKGSASNVTYAYGATPAATKSITITGYTQTSTSAWYTNLACTTTFTSSSLTGDKTTLSVYSPVTPKQAKLRFNTNGATNNGTIPANDALTATYDAAIPSYASYVAPTKTGYTLQGWYTATSGGKKYLNADFSAVTGTYAVWQQDTTDATTLYAQWVENKSGATIKANTDGTSASATGGTVKVGTGSAGATATISNNTIGIDTASAAIVATPKTGYHFVGWRFTSDTYSHLRYSFDKSTYTAPAAKNTTYGTSTNTTIYLKTDGISLTTDNTIVEAMFEINTYDLTVSKVSADTSAKATANNYSTDNSAGTVTIDSAATNPKTVNHGTTHTLNATAASGYKFKGWYNSSGTLLSESASYTTSAITSATTIYARFDRKYTLTINAGSNGTASSSSITTFYSDTPASFTLTPNPGYRINYSGSTNLSYYYEEPSGTTGTQTMTAKTVAAANKVDKTITIAYTEIVCNLTFGAQSTLNGTYANATDTTGGTVSANTYTESSSDSGSGSGSGSGSSSTTYTDNDDSVSGSVSYQTKVRFVATPAAGYGFIGWYDGTGSNANLVSTDTELRTGALEDDYTVYARFAKVYYLSLYNTTQNIGTDEAPDFKYITSPPMRVTSTTTAGNAVTYNYKKNSAATSEASTRTGGEYNEGDLLTVYAGDTVVLTYSALASSDTISGIFFNNARQYTCENEDDNLYKLREYKAEGWGSEGDDNWDYDYMATTTLYANENYYEGAIASTITSQKANYQADVDNNAHTVTFTAISDYKNIDLEVATKRQFIFVDETGADIRSEMTDNYYNPLSEVSASSATTKFGVKPASSDTCVYAWGTGDKVTFWKNEACTQAAEGISLAASADADDYYVISGTMPNYDVYVKLNIVTKYNLYLGGRIVADSFEHYDSFGDVANYYVKDSKEENTLLTGLATTANVGPTTVTKGTDGTVTLTYNFLTSGWDRGSYYSFIGWYKGDEDGPDYANGKLSSKQTFAFIPKANTYIYAVGTRDVYINGSANITGSENGDWNTVNGVDQNFRMEFDPNYVNSDGGAVGRYYWVVKDEWFAASGTGGVGNFTIGSYRQDGQTTRYYWNDENNKGTNSFFQIRDSATGTNKSLWASIDSFVSEKSNIKFAKIRAVASGDDWDAVQKREGLGTIKFKESDYNGYTSPITIYYYPGRGFSVEPTPTFSNLYVSNGFDVGGTSRATATTVTVPTGETSFTITSSGAGWSPDHEGHVQHYIPEKKNAKVRITKTCSVNEKVAAFDVYDLDNDKFYSITNVSASGNDYYIDFQCTMQQNLYIVPVIEENSADLTINFDGTQLNKTQWGDIVTAYAWYSNGSSTPALGAYPGQPMIVSDDGNTWTAKMPSKKTISGTKYSLAGILFTNYVDGNHSWLGINGVMGTVTYGGEGTSASPTTVSIADGGLIKQYNYIESGDNKEYSRANFKAQTYDYREPVAIYQNEATEEGVETTITFAMKDGDSSLISWRHTDLINANVVTETNPKWKLRFEYLTNSTGKKYSDLNGQPLEGTPTATYYIAAKGQVIYKNDSMTDVYYSGKSKDTPSPAVSYGLSGTSINFNYAVQWYVYDAQGNYITNVLSAAFADQQDGMSYIAKKLDDLGYAVDGKSVAICYDKPRYMYTDHNNVINSGSGFDAYRFEGQWYATVKTEPVTVSVGVGMMTENGEVLADGNSAGYGSATAAYSTTYGTAAYAHSNDGTKSVTVALADANKRLVKLDADATNFIGWYYYDVNTGEFTKVTNYTSNTNFYPNFNADVTYYAMYEAAATYQYNYTGRESGKSYSVSGGMLTDDEMSGGNKVSMDRSDFGTKAPGKDQISIFKKTIDFNNPTNKNNDTQYILQETFTPLIASYSLTYYYPSTKGGDVVTHSVTQQYNTTVDLSSCNVKSLAGTGKVFMGWYEFDTSKEGDARYGKLLTTQPNYGFVMTKAQTIAARYGDAAATDSGWKAFIDDSEVNKEMTSTVSGTYYNDTIVRFRNGVNAADALPSGTEVGVLIFNDGKKGTVSNPSKDKLNEIADELRVSGEKATIGSAGKFVTKLCKTVGTNVNPTYYNRIDFALRSDYTDNHGSKFKTYAYAKIGETYYWSDASEIGSYS